MSTVSTDSASSSPSPSPAPALSPPAPKDYSIFRKRFHVPTAWAQHADFAQLDKYTYATANHMETMEFVRTTLKKMGYDEASPAMKHDYLCFMLEDTLRAKGKAFLSERDLRQNDELARFIGEGKQATPDLMLAWDKKWCLIDVYTGDKPDNEIKMKYKIHPTLYSVHIINTKYFRSDLSKKLPGLFTEEELTYLDQNFSVFHTEYQYWKSCFELGMILRNEHMNIKVKDFQFPGDEEKRKEKLTEAMRKTFEKAIEASRPLPDYL